MGDNFRLAEITRIRNEFETELSHREHMRSKYKRMINILEWFGTSLNATSVALTSCTMGLTLSGVGAPVAILSGVGAALTLLGGVLTTPIKKKLGHKHKKHVSIGLLTQDRYHKIRKRISEILGDGDVSKEEYDSLIDELDRLKRLRRGIKTAYKSHESTVDQEVLKKEIEKYLSKRST